MFSKPPALLPSPPPAGRGQLWNAPGRGRPAPDDRARATARRALGGGGAGEGPAPRKGKEASHAHHPTAARLSVVRQPKLFPSWGFGFMGMRRCADSTQGPWWEARGEATWPGCARRPPAALPVATPRARPRAVRAAPRTISRVRKGRPGAWRDGEAPGCGGRPCAAGTRPFLPALMAKEAGVYRCRAPAEGGKRGVSHHLGSDGLRLQPPPFRPFLYRENARQPNRDWQH